jgi:formylglycine-generating enzyme required for sulfatase activity
MAPAEGSDLNEFVATAPRRPQPRTTVNPKFEVPAGFEIVAEGGFDEQGIPRRLRCTADSMEMAFVPAGTFLLGIDGRSLEVGPQHAVFVDGFYMDVLEVSLKQYELFRVATLTTRKPATAVNPFDPPDFPALGISWRDAQNYAKWAGKELPTEAEWEYAARGTEGFEYPWGNGRPIWEADRRPGQIEPVGSHPNDRSLFGIMDMAGSAREWCADWYAPDTYLQAKTPDGSPPRNPLGAERPSIPNARVLKGAGASGWQLWARSYAAMKDQLPDVAVRCVLRVKLPVEDVAAPLVAPAVP